MEEKAKKRSTFYDTFPSFCLLCHSRKKYTKKLILASEALRRAGFPKWHFFEFFILHCHKKIKVSRFAQKKNLVKMYDDSTILALGGRLYCQDFRTLCKNLSKMSVIGISSLKKSWGLLEEMFQKISTYSSLFNCVGIGTYFWKIYRKFISG